MKTSALLAIAAVAAFSFVLINLAVAASIFFGLGLCGLVAGDYARKPRFALVGDDSSRVHRRRTEPLGLAV
jgi:hypothetical protein